jgi:predicted dehydrogenase
LTQRVVEATIDAMRVGVVGCGYWGSKHVRVLHTVANVTGVVIIEANRGVRESMLRSFPAATAFASLEAAYDHVDAVIVATPPHTHAAVARQAIEAGKHVLVEKPLATTGADSQMLIDESEKRGLTLMVGHTFLYNAAVLRLRDAVRSGELGRVCYVDSARLNLGLYQSDVNVVWDLAPHDVSISNFVLGSLPSSVSCWGVHRTAGVEDVASLQLDYPSIETSTSIRVSWLDPCKVRRTTVVGTEKMAVYNDLNDLERIRIYDRGVSYPVEPDYAMPTSYRYGDVVSPYVDFREPLGLEDTDFVNAALVGRLPQANGRHGMAVVRIIEAAQQSLKSGGRVNLEWSADDWRLALGTGAAETLDDVVAADAVKLSAS